jgi:hypothetical protein
MPRQTNSELEPPFIPPVDYDLLTDLEGKLVADPDCWNKQFRVHQLRLYAYCRHNLRNYMVELQRDDVLSELSLIYAGLRTTIQQDTSGTLVVDDLPRVEGLGSHLFNTGLVVGHGLVAETPFTELTDDGGMRSRFSRYQPHASYQLIEYVLRRGFDEPQTTVVFTAAAFMYDTLERQIQINLLDTILGMSSKDNDTI